MTKHQHLDGVEKYRQEDRPPTTFLSVACFIFYRITSSLYLMIEFLCVGIASCAVGQDSKHQYQVLVIRSLAFSVQQCPMREGLIARKRWASSCPLGSDHPR